MVGERIPDLSRLEQVTPDGSISSKNFELDCLINIFSYLAAELTQWGCLRTVCRRWHELSKSSRWIRLFSKKKDYLDLHGDQINGCEDRPGAEILTDLEEVIPYLSPVPALSLSHFRVSSASFEHLGSFSSLHLLRLAWCDFTSFMLDMSSFTTLRHLELGCGTFRSIEFLSSLTKLQILNLYRPLASLGVLSCLTDLHTLRLLGCLNFRVEDLRIIARLKLKELQLVGISFADLHLSHVSSLSSLTNLSIYNCRKDSGLLRNLLPLANLTTLNVMECSLTDEHCIALAALMPLKYLSLFECQAVSDSGLGLLCGLTALKELRLYNCQLISDLGIECLSQLSFLTLLLMQYKSPVMRRWRSLTNLKSLCELIVTDVAHICVTDQLALQERGIKLQQR